MLGLQRRARCLDHEQKGWTAVTSTIRIAPPNSMVAITDLAGGEVPLTLPSSRLASTPSCILVGCLAFADGPTTFTLGPPADKRSGLELAVDRVMETPSRFVIVSTVEGEVLLSEAVGELRTRVRVWLNRAREPDIVDIALD
jgi:hypothetical protein